MKYLFLICFCIAIVSSLYAQDVCGGIQYTTQPNMAFWKQRIDMLDAKNEHANVAFVRSIISAFKNEKFDLSFFNKKSSFKGISPKPNDLLGNELTAWMLATAFSKSTHHVLFDQEANVIKTIIPQGTVYVEVINKNDFYNWHIQADTSQNIQGYTCLRATTQDTLNKGTEAEVHKTYEAWFTPDIPLPFGPGNYVGLPGLVLIAGEVDGRFYYTVSNINIKNSNCNQMSISLPKTVQTYTNAEWLLYNEQLAAKLRKR